MNEGFGLIPTDKKTQISEQIQDTEKTFSLGYQKIRYPLDSKKAYQEVVLNISAFVSNVSEVYMNRRFHDSLNVIESNMGLVSTAKQEQHIRVTKMKKEVIVAATTSALHALPHLYAWHQEKQAKNDFLNCLASWSGWIVEEEHLAYRGKIESILKNNNSYNERKVRSAFQQHVGGELQKLPPYTLDNREEFFKMLAFLSDAGNPEHSERVYALGREGLGLRESQIEECIQAAEGGQLTASDFVSFNSNFINDYARDLFDSLPQAAQFTNYMEANDPYRFGREARLQQFKSAGSKLAVGGVLAAITLTTGGVGDAIVAASGPVLFNLIGGEETKKQIEFTKAYKEMLGDIKRLK